MKGSKFSTQTASAPSLTIAEKAPLTLRSHPVAFLRGDLA